MISVLPIDRDAVAAAQVTVARHHYLHKPVDARCSVEDVARGKAAESFWSVLNLARVYFDPCVQPGGNLHTPAYVPGFTDRHGEFRSTLASTAIGLLADRVVLDYLLRRPPCFLDEPYELRWLLSYCDTRLHRGVLYRAAGFELVRTNTEGVQTWRLSLRPLVRSEHEEVAIASARSPRSIRYRMRRAQGALSFDACAS